jgi:hypothetical protein
MQYLQWRVDHAKKTPAISTLRNEKPVLNQIFRFAKRTSVHVRRVGRINNPLGNQVAVFYLLCVVAIDVRRSFRQNRRVTTICASVVASW